MSSQETQSELSQIHRVAPPLQKVFLFYFFSTEHLKLLPVYRSAASKASCTELRHESRADAQPVPKTALKTISHEQSVLLRDLADESWFLPSIHHHKKNVAANGFLSNASQSEFESLFQVRNFLPDQVSIILRQHDKLVPYHLLQGIVHSTLFEKFPDEVSLPQECRKKDYRHPRDLRRTTVVLLTKTDSLDFPEDHGKGV